MVADGTVYPASCKPDDVIFALQQNRLQYLFTDVQFRGAYPASAQNYFAERKVHLQIEPEDM